MYIVLMAGGAGTRFWPLSRFETPKQLLKITGEKTMLQETYDRVTALTTPDKILIITGAHLVAKVAAQLPALPEENIIAEPFGRNTAPCIALASAIIRKRSGGDEAVSVVVPADHMIGDDEAFCDIIRGAVDHARGSEVLMTLGIKPAYPETGYGYIQREEEPCCTSHYPIYRVKTFAEKPNMETAARFLESGDFYWNSGIFVWTVKAIMKEFQRQMPDMYEMLPDVESALDTENMAAAIEHMYSSIRPESIDYGIMENAEQVRVIESEFNWNDVGSWEAVYNISPKTKDENAHMQAIPMTLDSRNNFFYTSGGKLVAAIDVHDLIMVETEDTILLCKRQSSQRVKEIVDKLKIKDLTQYL